VVERAAAGPPNGSSPGGPGGARSAVSHARPGGEPAPDLSARPGGEPGPEVNARPGGEAAADPYARLQRATAGLQAPFALVDLDAMWANADDLEMRAASKPIRLASKSLRCRALQERVLQRPGFVGTLAFTLPEALWLASFVTDDLLVAYPTADSHALRALAERPTLVGRVTVMVDDIEQLELIERAIGRSGGGALRVCIDVDAGWWKLGGRVRVGAKRSPVHTPTQAAALAREILARPRLQLVGIMAYEAQIAGLGDTPAGRPLRARVIRALQSRSARELAVRRAACVAAVADVLAAARAPALQLVNGGGTGSLERTAAERAVTEVTAGSGLYGPTLFDAYRAFSPRPAAIFALPVVRRPGPGVVTALGGGYLASGPADRARLPRPHLPRGLRLDGQEGAGEVQTPLIGSAADAIAVGDSVFMRHAKAGELSERFNSLYLIEGEEIVDQVPTYRGEGQCFL
jgi:D-serine deaminase-like pyridoxal phosphate-dependent protein